MARQVPIITRAIGINNRVDPFRVPYAWDSGVSALAAAVNVDVDDSGGISRMTGYTKRTSGNYHSLFSVGETGLVVDAAVPALCRVTVSETAITAAQIKTLNSAAPMSYAAPGNGKAYFMNGVDMGVVSATGVADDWTPGEYLGPETTEPLSAPPVGEVVRFHRGYFYVIVNDPEHRGKNAAFFSKPFSEWFALRRDYFAFPDRIVFVRGVDDGVYIGTAGGVYFAAGTDPSKARAIRVTSEAPVFGTDCSVDGADVGDGYPGEAAMWAGPSGVHLGTSGGRYFNVTRDSLRLPSASRGFGFSRTDGGYIAIFEP